MAECVVVQRAPEMDYRQDYVALPKNYGKPAYFARADVRAIYDTVFRSLQTLDAEAPFTAKLAGYRQVVIKPNLVAVYHNAGLAGVDYPESTDPRVLDAVVAFFKQYNPNITIAESSGKPMPTRNSFHVSGIDRLAKYHRCRLVALETRPVVRYVLPKAEVMREIYIPDVFDAVVAGDAFYVSVPKMKTNLYTMVTLGFKNAMGSIPYFMRERNHNHAINKKIADMLYILRPDVVLIDGIIGGEGNTPAPVDPVDVGVIIAGNNAVETDRVATRMMGIDPAEVPLMREADARGFAAPAAKVIGSRQPVAFRRASPSLMDDGFHAAFPNLLALAGHTLPAAPRIDDVRAVTPALARQLEAACTGGCLAALRSGYDYVAYAPKPRWDFPLVVLMGAGIPQDGTRYWFDRDGTPYSTEQVLADGRPILTLGNCTASMKPYAKYKTTGCCNPSKCMLAATKSAGVGFPLLTVQNKSFLHFGASAVGMVAARCWHTLRGRWVDCPSAHEDKVFAVPTAAEMAAMGGPGAGMADHGNGLAGGTGAAQVKGDAKNTGTAGPGEGHTAETPDTNADYLPWPLPKMDGKTKRKLLRDQLSILEL